MPHERWWRRNTDPTDDSEAALARLREHYDELMFVLACARATSVCCLLGLASVHCVLNLGILFVQVFCNFAMHKAFPQRHQGASHACVTARIPYPN